MKLSTWNVRTMMTGMNTDDDLDNENDIRKTAVIDTELSMRNIHIAALQETRLADSGTIKEEHYTFFWFGRPADQARLYGTGFAVRNDLLSSIVTPTAVSDRISTLKLNTQQGSIKIISAYAPTLAADDSDKDNFYNQLEDVISSTADTERIVLLGDMNARVGDDHLVWPDCMGKFGVGHMNENGQRLLELCCRNGLCITNTIFPGKPHRKMSWCHPRSKKWHQLDFIIVRQKHRGEVHNTRTYHSADCDTDHSLVLSTMLLKPRPHHSQVKQSRKIDVTKAGLPDLKDQYCKKLNEKLDLLQDDPNPDVCWTNLRSAVHEAALETFGHRKRRNPDWYIASLDTIQPALEEKRQALLRLKSRPTRQSQDNFRKARSMAQKTVRKCMEDYWDDLCSRIETARDTGNIKGMYESIRTATGPSAQTGGVIKSKDGTVIEDKQEKLNRWIEHYSELYGTEGTTCLETLSSLPNLPLREGLDEEPEIDEVISTVQSLRNGKAAGADEIPGELLKAGIIPLATHLHSLIIKCWKSKKIPQDFKDAKITTLYKNKGDRGDCNSYRGISLLSVTGKVLAKIILKRLQQIAEDIYPESQCGFRAQRSTTDMVFAVRQLQEKAREQRRPLYLAFVDLTKAFDLVDRKSLFAVLLKAGCPPTMLSLIQSFHDDMKGQVQFDGELSDKFDIRRGVKQGCVLAPSLFGIFFSYVFQVAFQDLDTHSGVSILTRADGNFFNLARFKAKTKTTEYIIRELLYADDAALCASTPEGLQNMLDTLADSCVKFGLTISLKKTVTMSQANTPHTFNIQDTTLENVDKFTYLGSSMNANTTLDTEISARLGKAASTFGRLTKRVWKNKHLSINTKVRVYEACVLSVLLYGSECWPTYRHQESRLSAFHTRNLRFIIGKTWEDRMTNEELFKITKSEPLSSKMKYIRIRWAGHVNRMESKRIPHQLLHAVLLEGKRQTGRPNLRFKDVLKRDLRDFDIAPESWTNASKDRQTWRASLHRGRMADTNSNLQRLREQRLKRHDE
jgi:hypothetical protein